MKKLVYVVTFGQRWRTERHPHAINGVYPHPDGWFEIHANSYTEAHRLAMQVFGGEFAQIYPHHGINLEYFPLGRLGQIPAPVGVQPH